MGLIIEGTIQYGVSPSKFAAPFYLPVFKSKLSVPYQLSFIPTTFIDATILSVKVLGRQITDAEQNAITTIVGKQIEFYFNFSFVGNSDFLYFTQKSWEVLRNAGLFTSEYFIQFKLTKVKKEGKQEEEIYPLRDMS
ncbi:MAG: hypothetical protein HYU02_07135 [Thaumarchaeota archaeon]|nr:hypothetical protein [Nitrososphaerota archaeon]